MAFEAGQRWACVTDLGAEAFLEIHGIDGAQVHYSWGTIAAGTTEMTTLCGFRDKLVLSEIQDFCRPLGNEASKGHRMLRDACAGKSGN